MRYLMRVPLARRTRGTTSRRRRGISSRRTRSRRRRREGRRRRWRRRRGMWPFPPSGSEARQDSWSDRYLWRDGRLFGLTGKGKYL